MDRAINEGYRIHTRLTSIFMRVAEDSLKRTWSKPRNIPITIINVRRITQRAFR